jgi:hypothetical protein
VRSLIVTMRNLAFLAGTATFGLLGTSCELLKPPPPAPFEVIVRVESDPGRPLAGAIIAKGGKDGPATGADGKVTLKILGHEGESVDLTVKCPTDYVSSPKMLTVPLRRGSKLPEYDWSCPPAIRHLVVAIRTDGAPSLSVSYLGRSIGRTDANGAFTHMFALRPGDGVELLLDTTGVERIHPVNPPLAATVKEYDDIVTFEQRFKVDPAPVVYHAGPAKPVDINAYAKQARPSKMPWPPR